VYLPLDESHPQIPVNPYGDTKLFVEKMLRWYGEAYGMRWAALCYFSAAGADVDAEIGESHDPEPHLIPLVIQAAMGYRPEVGILGTNYATPDGTAIRDYIHVKDLAQEHILAMQHLANGNQSGAFNLGTGRGYSVREIIAAVERHSGQNVPTREMGRRAGDPDCLVAGAERACQILGWRHAHGLDSIIKTAWAWELRKKEHIQTILHKEAR
jgi:UDP-glucose 4-epimerase